MFSLFSLRLGNDQSSGERSRDDIFNNEEIIPDVLTSSRMSCPRIGHKNGDKRLVTILFLSSTSLRLFSNMDDMKWRTPEVTSWFISLYNRHVIIRFRSRFYPRCDGYDESLTSSVSSPFDDEILWRCWPLILNPGGREGGRGVWVLCNGFVISRLRQSRSFISDITLLNRIVIAFVWCNCGWGLVGEQGGTGRSEVRGGGNRI